MSPSNITEIDFTYYLNRICRNCGDPIPDQEHATREFCREVMLPNGKMLDCKDVYWANKRKEEPDPFVLLVRYQKSISAILQMIWETNRDSITADELTELDIPLSRCLDRKVNDDGSLSHYYIGFEIIAYPNAKTLKIKPYDDLFF